MEIKCKNIKNKIIGNRLVRFAKFWKSILVKSESFNCFCRMFMENVGPIMDEEAKKSGVTAQQVVQEVLSQTAGGQTGKDRIPFRV